MVVRKGICTTRALIPALISLVFLSGCACKGLITKHYDESLYRVVNLLPDRQIGENQHFLVYSDCQAGWRAYEAFLRGKNWTDRKMFIVPFYQLYLLGNGIAGGINYLFHRPDYGGRERRMMRNAIYAAAKRWGAAFIMNVGDICSSDGRRPAHWKIFLRENRVEHPLLNEIPYLPVLGNHEYANDTVYGFPNYEAIFGYPRFYTVESDDVILLVLNSSYLIDQFQYIDDEAQDRLFEEWFVSPAGGEPSWLERELEHSRKPFKIVVMHHPPITFAMHYRDWHRPAYGRDLLVKRKALLELFATHGVQVVFSGHDHSYQHNVLRLSNGGVIHFLIGGGAGAPLREGIDIEKRERYRREMLNEGLEVTQVQSGSFYHYFAVEVRDGILNIKTVEVTGDDDNPLRTVETLSFDSGR
ncbi:MAG: metallophosphoesterase [bacterium]|nr:MAG: metallophosphoesterase [bacterium]